MIGRFSIAVICGLLLAGVAWANGVPAAGQGEMCGGIAGIPCEAGLWCDSQPESCGWADAGGQCIKVPEVCIQIYDPVCGCDGRTYGNDCERQAAKVGLRHEGECGQDG